ncbi:hypothetical protein Dsin_015525 [Dipteronia sinensis]|uniref:Uncharacterized protein n=1 Tax=Dipteronia sinensis TaxID=43782 RepID=A0AAE0ABH3_9ROSI|nr:hypothetical protein Dsin_015525 [Dipteronia sinensis]
MISSSHQLMLMHAANVHHGDDANIHGCEGFVPFYNPYEGDGDDDDDDDDGNDLAPAASMEGDGDDQDDDDNGGYDYAPAA